MTPVIKTPRGQVFIGENGKARLAWNTNKFTGKSRGAWQAKYSNAQVFVDSEVLRRCEPYIPLLTSMLIKSGILGTDVGSGLVMWIAPYAKRQYYSPRKPGSQTGPLRGPYWFARMKAVDGKDIIKGAKKLAGGG